MSVHLSNNLPLILTHSQHTINLPLNREMKARDIRNIYADRFAGEKLIKVIGESPSVKNISGKHGIEVGGFGVHSSGKRVVVNVTIDNLLKGAATQCLQNMNLALGEFMSLWAESQRHADCDGRIWRVRGNSSMNSR